MAVKHNEDGWDLVEYEWDERNGLAELTYEREVDGKTESALVVAAQPTNETHVGWYIRPI